MDQSLVACLLGYTLCIMSSEFTTITSIWDLVYIPLVLCFWHWSCTLAQQDLLPLPSLPIDDMAGGDGSKALSILLRIAALCLSVAAAVVMGTASDQVMDADGGRRSSTYYAVSYSQYNALK